MPRTASPHDLLAQADRLRIHTEKFILDPDRWLSFAPIASLNWQSVKFERISKTLLPKERGIYAFVLKLFSNNADEAKFPSHGYILYGGITDRTLQIRFGDYLRENGKRRLRIFQMTQRWPNNLYFYYSPIPDKSVNLKDLEKQFNDTVIPPFSQYDFSSDLKASKSAAF
ncbi:hypothetical protein [Acinetobacter schindleri]|uniref:hypothetical protein n=1 Tax=Acinetobacter schindleri TaxID=108981 RepID=UPI004046069B